MLHEFTVNIPYESVTRIIDQLNANGIYNFYYEQPINQIIIPNGFGIIEKESTVQLKIYFDEEINIKETKKELSKLLSTDAIQYQVIKLTNWQQPFPIIDLNNGWFIVPNSEKQQLEGKIILIEPPCAFGTGLHPTTQDCLRFILNESFEGKRVLDLGTGSGILSIAASLVGAQKIVAVDIEDVKNEVQYNAILNNVEKNISVIQCDVLQSNFKIKDKFDWIFINIGGDESKALCSFIKEHLLNNGQLILSGMVEWNFENVISYYGKFGFEVLKCVQSEEWVTALLRKINK